MPLIRGGIVVGEKVSGVKLLKLHDGDCDLGELEFWRKSNRLERLEIEVLRYAHIHVWWCRDHNTYSSFNNDFRYGKWIPALDYQIQICTYLDLAPNKSRMYTHMEMMRMIWFARKFWFYMISSLMDSGGFHRMRQRKSLKDQPTMQVIRYLKSSSPSWFFTTSSTYVRLMQSAPFLG